MIVGIGIDIIEIERIQGVYARHGERFAQRILTAAEYAYVMRFKEPSQRLAGLESRDRLARCGDSA